MTVSSIHRMSPDQLVKRAAADDPDELPPWWKVPEKPGIGMAMLRGTLVWFVSLVAIVAILGALS